MWRQVRAHRSGAALGRSLLETLSTAEWQLYGISAITFRTNLENLLRSEFSLHANLLNALDLLLVKRMRARSNELSVKSCMPQRNWGGVQRVDADKEKGAQFLRLSNCFSWGTTNELQHLWRFPTVKTYTGALTCCFSSFICSLFFLFSSAATIAVRQQMK